MSQLEQFLRSEDPAIEFSPLFQYPVDYWEEFRWMMILDTPTEWQHHSSVSSPIISVSAPVFSITSWLPSAEFVRTNALIKNPFGTFTSTDAYAATNALFVHDDMVLLAKVHPNGLHTLRPVNGLHQEIIKEQIYNAFPDFLWSEYTPWEDYQ